MPIKISVFGANGRLGRSIIQQMGQDFTLSGEPDLYIDASLPPGVFSHIETALLLKRPIVIGVTALEEKTEALMADAAKSIPIFYSSNFSLGAALLKKLSQFIATHFHPNADIDLIETHHVEKKDIPSGTAVALEKALRKKGKNPTLHSIRSAQTVGVHELIFNTAEEKISLTHTAHSRDAFGRGALAAATFLIKQPPGLYGMEDLLIDLRI